MVPTKTDHIFPTWGVLPIPKTLVILKNLNHPKSQQTSNLNSHQKAPLLQFKILYFSSKFSPKSSSITGDIRKVMVTMEAAWVGEIKLNLLKDSTKINVENPVDKWFVIPAK